MGEGARPGPTINGGTMPAGDPPRKQRRSSRCGPCCILKHLLAFLITVIIIVGIAALVIWLVLRPTKPKFYVDTVKWSNMSSSSSSSKIVVGMSVRNSNKKMGIYYDALLASAYYNSGGGLNAVEEFYQGHKNTTTLPPLLISVRNVKLLSTWKGVKDVKFKLRSRLRFRIGKVKTNRFKVKVKCSVSVPLNQTTAAPFTRKKCRVKLDY